MARRNLALELIQGIEEIRAWKRGEVKLKSGTVELPWAADVPQIRKALGYSQQEFAALMGVSVGTLRNCEQARRSRTARRARFFSWLPAIPPPCAEPSRSWQGCAANHKVCPCAS